MTAPQHNERPNAEDWEELVREWWMWAGDFAVHTSWLYVRVAAYLDGFQYEPCEEQGKMVRFGQDLRKRRGQQVGGMTLRSALR